MSETQAGAAAEKHSEQGTDARAVLLRGYNSILSTHSVDVPGYPFGSVAPYCLDAQGRPVVLISDLAQHTKNLRADPRASMIILADGSDIQINARLTLLGDFQLVPEAEVGLLAERYYRFFPNSRGYHTSYDFRFWALSPVRARFIGGFGRIHWVNPELVLRANPFGYERESDIVVHMNEDHQDALWHYCTLAGIHVPDGAKPQMVGIDAEGLHLRVGERIERIAFEHAVETPGAAREILVSMARAGRG